MATVYNINKGINKPIEFRGLKAQYIVYLGIGLVLHLILFAVLYIAGLNPFVCLIVILSSGTALLLIVSRLSRLYGQYGLMKLSARRRIPEAIIVKSRRRVIKTTRA